MEETPEIERSNLWFLLNETSSPFSPVFPDRFNVNVPVSRREQKVCIVSARHLKEALCSLGLGQLSLEQSPAERAAGVAHFGEDEVVDGHPPRQDLLELPLQVVLHLGQVVRLKQHPQRALHRLSDHGTAVPPHNLDPLGVKGGRFLVGALVHVAHVALLGDEHAGVVHFLHLELHRGGAGGRHRGRDLGADAVRVGAGAALEEHEHAAHEAGVNTESVELSVDDHFSFIESYVGQSI